MGISELLLFETLENAYYTPFSIIYKPRIKYKKNVCILFGIDDFSQFPVAEHLSNYLLFNIFLRISNVSLQIYPLLFSASYVE